MKVNEGMCKKKKFKNEGMCTKLSKSSTAVYMV